MEMMLIPDRHMPVKNLIMTNIIYDEEKALRIANVNEDM